MTAPSTVDIRCPVGPRKLLAKMLVNNEKPVVTSDNLLELACQDCRRNLRQEGHDDIRLVVHRFNIIGELVMTEILRVEISGAEHPSEG